MKAIIAGVVLMLIIVTCCYKAGHRIAENQTDNIQAAIDMLQDNPTAAGKR